MSSKLQSRKECALCGTTLPVETVVSLCGECMKIADCACGLEKLHE